MIGTMNGDEFLNYIARCFDIGGDAMRLIANILSYAERLDPNQQYPFLCEMLDGTIGLSDAEIKRVSL